MQDQLMFSIDREKLDIGPMEEQKVFGLLRITTNRQLLTEGFDAHLNSYREGPLVSGYHLAEWLVWNWWRLRWEPKHPDSPDLDSTRHWDFAHRLQTIGEGYAWPNITIFSDGYRSMLISEPSRAPDAAPFRYVGAPKNETITAQTLEVAIDEFVSLVLEWLTEAKLDGTNLQHLWHDLQTERENLEISCFRRLEARLGCDPDEADEDAIKQILADAAELGENALEEVAAATAYRGTEPPRVMSANQIKEIARQRGFDATSHDAVQLATDADIPKWGTVEAWRIGVAAAREIRHREKLGSGPIENKRLAELAGTTDKAISDTTKYSDKLSFVFDREGAGTRLALRSRWEVNRRFDLARLTGDRLFKSTDRLFPATLAYSYRQKVQRAFAGELLSPYITMNDMLDGDYSEDKQIEIADHYHVSQRTIQTLLINHKRISREDFPDTF